MKKSIFYNKKTIISFIVLSLFGLYILDMIIQLMNTASGVSTSYGLPFAYCWENASLGQFGLARFNMTNLILDIVVYYILAIIISALSNKSKNKAKK